MEELVVVVEDDWCGEDQVDLVQDVVYVGGKVEVEFWLGCYYCYYYLDLQQFGDIELVQGVMVFYGQVFGGVVGLVGMVGIVDLVQFVE